MVLLCGFFVAYAKTSSKRLPPRRPSAALAQPRKDNILGTTQPTRAKVATEKLP